MQPAELAEKKARYAERQAMRNEIQNLTDQKRELAAQIEIIEERLNEAWEAEPV